MQDCRWWKRDNLDDPCHWDTVVIDIQRSIRFQISTPTILWRDVYILKSEHKECKQCRFLQVLPKCEKQTRKTHVLNLAFCGYCLIDLQVVWLVNGASTYVIVTVWRMHIQAALHGCLLFATEKSNFWFLAMVTSITTEMIAQCTFLNAHNSSCTRTILFEIN